MKMGMGNFSNRIVSQFSILALGLNVLSACGVDEGEESVGTTSSTGSTDSTDSSGSTVPTTSGVTEGPEDYCANPKFADSGPASGESYVCQGHVEGDFSYNKCLTGACGIAESKPIDGDTGDGVIPFPPDPASGEGADVQTCCDPAIESDMDNGAEAGEAACISACAHAACNEAIARFQALLDDPATWAGCPNQACEDRVKQSLQHYKGYVSQNFDKCLIAASNAGSTLMMTNPGCTDTLIKTGCLANGVLTMTCTSVAIDFDSNFETCEEAMHQPPEAVSQSCTIDLGGGEVRGGTEPVSARFESGSAVSRYFDCAESLCPFVLDGLDIAIEDIGDSAYELTNLTAELVVAAYGLSDGSVMEFAPGALRIHVSGEVDDGTGLVPFDAYGSNSATADGSHDSDLLSLGWVIFEAGGYTFSAYIEEADCVDL
ncbi:hypothetical protein [Nannocystis sp. SCPEA4]|uniref:hypothetical protein n=1 Tax=Nannocystis sp. SCPEA4 TaxID=2996787 RepID=UPI00226F0248|nr:hypothetical protein [Nannocystis sp. SCPEA4]MCY1053914.1 hypothetical protein [Nannocystis sp. SCPEA4]